MFFITPTHPQPSASSDVSMARKERIFALALSVTLFSVAVFSLKEESRASV